jgi:formylglycine-generating enzyme required for sulfatase activity
MKKNILIAVGIAVALVIVILQVVIVFKLVSKDGEGSAFSFGKAKTNFVENANCDLDMNMIYVEGDTFGQGPRGDQRRVSLDSYWIGESEVTQAQWRAVMGTTIYEQRTKAEALSDEDRPLRGVGPTHPMYNVSYNEAKEFCRRLSNLTGRRYDLPTEAQWEFAARGGRKSCGYIYSGSDYLSEVAWHNGNSNTSTHPVKYRTPNELGLYDMSGNVQEWCKDWYDDYRYYNQHNPEGPDYGVRRVVRGGGWRWESGQCCVWFRERYLPTLATSYVGFRVVCLE